MSGWWPNKEVKRNESVLPFHYITSLFRFSFFYSVRSAHSSLHISRVYCVCVLCGFVVGLFGFNGKSRVNVSENRTGNNKGHNNTLLFLLGFLFYFIWLNSRFQFLPL